LSNKKIIAILRRLSDAVREETPKIKNLKLVPRSRQCSSTPVGFGQGFFSQVQCDNTGASSILSWPGSTWHLPVPSTEISIEGTTLSWCYRHN